MQALLHLLYVMTTSIALEVPIGLLSVKPAA